MVQVDNEITKEEYDQAQEKGAMSLITSEALLIGYGAYGAFVYEKDGKYYLRYKRGDSCD